MLPKTWRPGFAPDLVRVGPDHDGGYVIPKSCLDGSQFLLSFGLFDNWDFEEDFRSRSKSAVTCYDHTVTREFWVKRLAVDVAAVLGGKRRTAKQLRDIPKYLSYRRFFDQPDVKHICRPIGYNASGMVSVADAMRETQGRRTFIKMDIEGWEYRVTHELLEHENILGFVIEFHDVDLHRQRVSDFIEAANPDFELVHIHANNFGGIDDKGDPLVVEMTFVRPSATNLRIIHEIDSTADAPNNPLIPDIQLRFEST